MTLVASQRRPGEPTAASTSVPLAHGLSFRYQGRGPPDSGSVLGVPNGNSCQCFSSEEAYLLIDPWGRHGKRARSGDRELLGALGFPWVTSTVHSTRMQPPWQFTTSPRSYHEAARYLRSESSHKGGADGVVEPAVADEEQLSAAPREGRLRTEFTVAVGSRHRYGDTRIRWRTRNGPRDHPPDRAGTSPLDLRRY